MRKTDEILAKDGTSNNSDDINDLLSELEVKFGKPVLTLF